MPHGAKTIDERKDDAMTDAIPLPAHCVVLILGNARRSDPVVCLADTIPAISCPWNVQKPDESLERLHAALDEGRPVRVVMLNSNGKARRAVASAAKRRGAVAIALRLPGGETMAADEGYARVLDLAADARPDFPIVPSPCDLTHLTGPFDFVGDVHGCVEELIALLILLGHVDAATRLPQRHPQGRTLVLLGDLTDRGPANLAVLRLVRELEAVGALRVKGNHDEKLARWMRGNRKIRIAAGIAGTIAELEHLPDEELHEMGVWLGSAEPHVMLDGGRIAAAHAGIDERNQGRRSPGAQSFGLYGAATGLLDENDVPIASDWALDYAGAAVVVHGHVVHAEPRIVNNVVAIDTGCVFGGRLTAYRWPERTFESVPARGEFVEDRTADVPNGRYVPRPAHA
jgi:diadenosine tetraphosphatase ApaH/serine/threonine PP2A family protein phosphatase